MTEKSSQQRNFRWGLWPELQLGCFRLLLGDCWVPDLVVTFLLLSFPSFGCPNQGTLFSPLTLWTEPQLPASMGLSQTISLSGCLKPLDLLVLPCIFSHLNYSCYFAECLWLTWISVFLFLKMFLPAILSSHFKTITPCTQVKVIPDLAARKLCPKRSPGTEPHGCSGSVF